MADDAERAAALARCRFLPGSTDKRFARQMNDRALAEQPFTEKQAAHLARLAWRYRRQMPPPLVPKEKPP